MSSPRNPARSAWNSQFPGCGISADRVRRDPMPLLSCLSDILSGILNTNCGLLSGFLGVFDSDLRAFPDTFSRICGSFPCCFAGPFNCVLGTVTGLHEHLLGAPLSTCFTTPERTWTTSSSADASGTADRQAKAKRQNRTAQRLRIGMTSSLRFWCAPVKTRWDAGFANVVTKPV